MSWTWLVTVSAIDRAAIGHRLLGLGPEKDIFAPFDEDARFRLVARRQQADADEGQRRDEQRRNDNRAACGARSPGRSRRVQLFASRGPAVLHLTTHATNSIGADSGDISPSR